jgi:hypothetical protein
MCEICPQSVDWVYGGVVQWLTALWITQGRGIRDDGLRLDQRRGMRGIKFNP